MTPCGHLIDLGTVWHLGSVQSMCGIYEEMNQSWPILNFSSAYIELGQ